MSDIEIKYDVPIEVTEHQLNTIMTKLAGICAGRKDPVTGKCYIKCWHVEYADLIRKIISS